MLFYMFNYIEKFSMLVFIAPTAANSLIFGIRFFVAGLTAVCLFKHPSFLARIITMMELLQNNVNIISQAHDASLFKFIEIAVEKEKTIQCCNADNSRRQPFIGFCLHMPGPDQTNPSHPASLNLDLHFSDKKIGADTDSEGPSHVRYGQGDAGYQ